VGTTRTAPRLVVTLLQLQSGARVAIIGDVGGHIDELRAELSRLGVPQAGNGPIPDDLWVVQVGDLIHRGPDSSAVVALVDRCLSDDDCRWTQLVGNHEAFYLRRRRQFSWPDRVSGSTAAKLRTWWRTGRMRPAVALRVSGEDLLVTHAGLTRGFWQEVLGSPTSAGEAADALNALALSDQRTLFRPGMMLGYHRVNLAAGPVWASVSREVSVSWAGHPMPFSQVHGHSSVYDWAAQRWNVEEPVGDEVELDELRKHASLRLNGGRVVGIDPGHAIEARRNWQALELRQE